MQNEFSRLPNGCPLGAVDNCLELLGRRKAAMPEQKAGKVLVGEMYRAFNYLSRVGWDGELDESADGFLPLLLGGGWADIPIVGTFGFAFLARR